MNKILDALRTPSAMLVALLLALVAQLEHTAQVFSQVVNAQGVYATVHAYAFAIAVETAVLLFVLHEHRRISYMFAVATFATNLSYYAMHHVDLLSIAGAPAWLMAGLLPACIVGYSHVIAQPATPAKTPATVRRYFWQFWRKPAETPVSNPTSNTTTPAPIAPPSESGEHSEGAGVVESPRTQPVKAHKQPAARTPARTNEYGMTDAALAELLRVQRQAIGAMRNRGTLTARVARDLPQLEPVHVNGNGFNAQ